MPSLHFLIATFFGLGKLSRMPGTIGSIAAFPLYIILLFICAIINNGMRFPIPTIITCYMLIATLILFVIGVWASSKYEQESQNIDPKEVIIDEVVGQITTIILILALLPYVGEKPIIALSKVHITNQYVIYICFVGSFILFRLFDILKPWPIDFLDNSIKGGLGIMVDDIAAALMATVSFFAILLLATDLITKLL